MATSPAGCGADVVPQFEVHVGPDELASGAPSVLNSTPAEAVVSLEMMVLLMMFATNASCSEIPAPSQPATLSAMMLLVIFTEYQLEGVAGTPARRFVAHYAGSQPAADRPPARPRRCGREQLVADGHVRGDRVVVHVHVQVQAVLQLGTRGQAGLALAGARIRVGGAPDRVAGREQIGRASCRERV